MPPTYAKGLLRAPANRITLQKKRVGLGQRLFYVLAWKEFGKSALTSSRVMKQECWRFPLVASIECRPRLHIDAEQHGGEKAKQNAVWFSTVGAPYWGWCLLPLGGLWPRTPSQEAIVAWFLTGDLDRTAIGYVQRWLDPCQSKAFLSPPISLTTLQLNQFHRGNQVPDTGSERPIKGAPKKSCSHQAFGSNDRNFTPCRWNTSASRRHFRSAPLICRSFLSLKNKMELIKKMQETKLRN